MPVFISRLKGQLRLAVLALGAVMSSNAIAGEGLPTDRLIVKFRDTPTAMVQAASTPTVSTAVLDRLSTRIGQRLQAVRQTGTGAHVLRLPHAMKLSDVKAYAQKLQADPNVLYAEPDGIRKPAMTPPTDANWASQYDLFKGVGGIDMLDAWDYTTGSSAINVAVIDTGILNHPDLSGRILPGYDFVSGTINRTTGLPDYSWTGDGDGRDSDPTDPGDWVTAGQCGAGMPAEPSSWHGTHVAGTIAAVPNNKIGIAGINWQSGLLPVRALGKCGGYDSDIADAMLWANGLPVPGVLNNLNPARVLNLSLGGAGPCTQTYINAINRINNNRGIVVIAAGNDGGDATQSAPGNCPNVITVGAIGPSGSRAYYSNTGTNVTIMAPGGSGNSGILSTWNDGTKAAGNMAYGALMGTSMATPHVTGVVSLMLSQNQLLAYSDVVSKLRASATPFPSGSGCTTTTCGAGILNAAEAVRSASPLTVSAGTDKTVSSGQAVTLTGTASYGAVVPSAGISYQWMQISGSAVSLATANTSSISFTAPASSSTLIFKMTATDIYGNTNSSNVTVTVINGLPQLTVPAAQTVTAGNADSFTVSATGSATLSASNLPAGATFDASAGQFTWPSAGPAGTYTVQFTATNAQGSVSSSVAITVNQQLALNGLPTTGGGNSGGSSSGGGGGCVLNTNTPFDPLLPSLVVGALLTQVRRLRRKSRH